MYRLLVDSILPSTKTRAEPANADAPDRSPDVDKRTKATVLTAIHLLNPLVFTISTRGSSESVLSLFVLLTLYYAYRGRWTLAAVFLGVSTHWKIYPFVYGVACLGVIGGERGVAQGWVGYVRSLISWRTAWFTLVSGGTFAALGGAMYAM